MNVNGTKDEHTIIDLNEYSDDKIAVCRFNNAFKQVIKGYCPAMLKENSAN